MDYIAALRAQLERMAVELVASLPSLAIALIILLLTWVVARFAARISDLLVGRGDIRTNLKTLLDTVVRLAIWLTGIMLAAVVVMPGLTPASLLVGIGIGAIAIGFAFRDIFENFLAGVLIMFRKRMQIGDFIECKRISGKVEHISLRESHVRSSSNELTIVPNAYLFKNPVRILTDDDLRRYDMSVRVAHDIDLDRAADVIRRAMEKVEMFDQSRKIEVLAQRFNSSFIDFDVRWWAGSTPKAAHESRDRAVRAVMRALNDAGIAMPPLPHPANAFKQHAPDKRTPIGRN